MEINEKFKRSTRRYQEKIHKEKTKKKMKLMEIPEEEITKENVGKWSSHSKKCSCWMCGNARRNTKGEILKQTLQERKVKE